MCVLGYCSKSLKKKKNVIYEEWAAQMNTKNISISPWKNFDVLKRSWEHEKTDFIKRKRNKAASMSAWVEELQERDDIHSQSGVTWSNRRQRPPLKQWPLQSAVNKFIAQLWQFWPIKVQSMRFRTCHAQGHISYCVCATLSYLMNRHRRKTNAVTRLVAGFLFCFTVLQYMCELKLGATGFFRDGCSRMVRSFDVCRVLFSYFVVYLFLWALYLETGHRTELER